MADVLAHSRWSGDRRLTPSAEPDQAVRAAETLRLGDDPRQQRRCQRTGSTSGDRNRVVEAAEAIGAEGLPSLHTPAPQSRQRGHFLRLSRGAAVCSGAWFGEPNARPDLPAGQRHVLPGSDARKTPFRRPRQLVDADPLQSARHRTDEAVLGGRERRRHRDQQAKQCAHYHALRIDSGGKIHNAGREPPQAGQGRPASLGDLAT